MSGYAHVRCARCGASKTTLVRAWRKATDAERVCRDVVTVYEQPGLFAPSVPIQGECGGRLYRIYRTRRTDV